MVQSHFMSRFIFHLAALTQLRSTMAVSADDYAPYSVSCPSDANFIRAATGLSQLESEWLQGRDPVTKQALIQWLDDSGMTNFDAASFLGDDNVRIGFSFSGGGYRAMLVGAGAFAAADSRTDGASGAGQFGGLLDAVTYVAGLSGGNWLLGSLVVNNFTSVQDLLSSSSVWNLDSTILAPDGWDLPEDGTYYDEIYDSVMAKKAAGFKPSLTDIWGRALAYQFFNYPEGGVDLRYSDVRNYDAFVNHQTYFPIHVADGRAPGTYIINMNSTVVEFNPFELGSWDPSLYSFTDLAFLGTNVSAGQPLNQSQCINGFDSPGFMVGTSSSLFNEIFTVENKLPSALEDVINSILGDIDTDFEMDFAPYGPSPFFNDPYAGQAMAESPELDLVDGGEDYQNVPLQPLIQPARDIDIVFAFDNSADTASSDPDGTNWPCGQSLVATYERQFSEQGNGTVFPYVPDENTFVYGGLTEQPTFFGCDRDNLTSLFDPNTPESERHYPPVIVYLANSEHSFASNVSTLQLSYDVSESYAMAENGFNILTQNNGTIDSEWRTCVACAVVLREQQRRGEEPTDQCNQCFSRYCWDGTLVTDTSGPIQRRDGKSNLV